MYASNMHCWSSCPLECAQYQKSGPHSPAPSLLLEGGGQPRTSVPPAAKCARGLSCWAATRAVRVQPCLAVRSMSFGTHRGSNAAHLKLANLRSGVLRTVLRSSPGRRRW